MKCPLQYACNIPHTRFLEKVNKKSEKRPFKILNLAKEQAKIHRSFAKNLLQKCKITAFSMQYGCF